MLIKKILFKQSQEMIWKREYCTSIFIYIFFSFSSGINSLQVRLKLLGVVNNTNGTIFPLELHVDW